METSLSQKEKIAAAKKKLRKFQQKSARLDKCASSNGSHDNDTSSQHSQQSDVVVHQDTASHQQTIDILVEEKTELLKSRDKQTAINQQQQDEISVLKSQLYSANTDLAASHKKRAGLTNQHNSLNAQLQERERENSKLSLQAVSLNDQINVFQTELSALTSEREELNQRLSVAVVAQPQSAVHNDMSGVPSPFKRNEDVARLEKELARTLAELELAKSSLLNKEMQCDALAGRIAHQSTVSKEQLADLETKLEERDLEVKRLQDEVTTLNIAEHVTTEHVTTDDRSEETSVAEPARDVQQSEEQALQQERLKKVEAAFEQQVIQSLELQKELAQFKETHVDQNSLLLQINNDKATISRAMGQNKQLKEHMLELQEKLMRTSETNATLANEVQELSSHTSELMAQLQSARDLEAELRGVILEKDRQTPVTEDSILEGVSRSQLVKDLQGQLKVVKDKLVGAQQEKAILGLSAAQVESVKAMNVALQTKVSELSKQLDTGKSPNELALEEKIERLEKQYCSEAVDKRIENMLTNERLEREKQRTFLDKYYEGRLQEQVELLEERIAIQTRQFKQYITDLQVSHDDEVEALRTQLSELQQNFRSSLHTQYTQLVQYFTNKGVSDLRAREAELHSHYMEELSRLYSEMTKQVQKETLEIRSRKRTQSDELSIYTVEGKEDEEEDVSVWEVEKETLQSTISALEEEIVKIEIEETDSGEEDSAEVEETREQTKEERKLTAHVRVLQMQLSRAQNHQETSMQRYKQEIQRQTQVIEKLHMYLATQQYDAQHAPDHDACGDVSRDDNVSVTSAGQFERGDLSVTNENCQVSGPPNGVDGRGDRQETDTSLDNDFKSTEHEFEAKLKYLASKTPEGGEYVQHMQKLQEKFAYVMKDNANLQAKLEDVEHQNTILEGETDTIGEYISLYQSQRKALRLQFQQKDDFINKLLNERSDMQSHIGKLQQLITDLPCIEDAPSTNNNTLTRTRSDSICSNISTLSVMSTTRDEMLEIIGKLRLKPDNTGVVGGPLYGGHRGPIRDL